MEPRKESDATAYGTMTSWYVPGPSGPVVCVHGAGVSSRQTVPLLSAFGGRVGGWAVDLPGFGESTSSEGILGVAELADALLGWIRVKGVSKPCLLGASLGTQVVVEAAVRAPEEMGSVVLVGPTTDPKTRSLPILAGRLLWDSVYEGASMLPAMVADYRAAGSRRVLRSWQGSRDHHIERILPRVRQPALVVRGTKDKVCPRPWAEEVTRLLPRGRLVSVPGQPHALTAASPERLAGLVHDFVQEREEAG